MTRAAWAAALASAVALAAGCGTGGGDDRSIRVTAAASLTDAFTELARDFESSHPGTTVRLSFGPSSSLVAQLEAGAPADVLATADEVTMQTVVERGDVAGQPHTFARNTGTLAVPAGNPGDVTGVDDLARADLLVGLCAPEVPCGRLARTLLDAAGVSPSVDTEEPDVRALLTKLEEGELDAGIVYRTDVRIAAGDVEGIEIPGAEDAAVAYPIAVLERARDRSLADSFVDLVRSDHGREVLSRLGFLPPA